MSPPLSTFTYDDLKAFVLSQPLDAPINMKQVETDAPCSCILAQFGRTKGLRRAHAAMCELWAETGKDRLLGPPPDESEANKISNFIRRCINCNVQEYSEVLHLL